MLLLVISCATFADLPRVRCDDAFFTNSLGMKMIPVSFSTESEQRIVYFAESETTYREFKRFVNDSGYVPETEIQGKLIIGGKDLLSGTVPSTWKDFGVAPGANWPVMNISWNDAVEFCKWLSKREKRIYRLPSESEWEFACYDGKESLHEWFVAPDWKIVEYGNVGDALYLKVHVIPDRQRDREVGLPEESDVDLVLGRIRVGYIPKSDGFATLAPVKSYLPNRRGIYDMIGNVSEWCVSEAQNDDDFTVRKGGSWGSAYTEFALGSFGVKTLKRSANPVSTPASMCLLIEIA